MKGQKMFCWKIFDCQKNATKKKEIIWFQFWKKVCQLFPTKNEVMIKFSAIISRYAKILFQNFLFYSRQHNWKYGSLSSFVRSLLSQDPPMWFRQELGRRVVFRVSNNTYLTIRWYPQQNTQHRNWKKQDLKALSIAKRLNDDWQKHFFVRFGKRKHHFKSPSLRWFFNQCNIGFYSMNFVLGKVRIEISCPHLYDNSFHITITVWVESTCVKNVFFEVEFYIFHIQKIW